MSSHYGSLQSSPAHYHDGEHGGLLTSSTAATTGAGRFDKTKSAAVGKGAAVAFAVIGVVCVCFAFYGGGGGGERSSQANLFLGQPVTPSPCEDDPRSLNSCAAFYSKQSALSVKESTCPAGMKEEILPPSWWSKCQSQQGACPAGCGTCKPPDQQAGGGCFCAGSNAMW
eukprot:scaffold366_cov153-Skeletonema_menzelii.AAC.29